MIDIKISYEKYNPMVKKLLVTLLILFVLAAGGIHRFNQLATKPIDPAEFSLINKIEIYLGFLAMTAFGFPLYPEISKEMWYMLLPSSEGKKIFFEDDFFMDSEVVKNAIKGYSKPTRLYWHPSHYNLGESEARVALAFNGGFLHLENDYVLIESASQMAKV